MKNGISKIVMILVLISVIGSGVALYKVFNSKTAYREIEVRTTEDYIQYKYKDSVDWNNLVKLDTLIGKSGKEVEIKKDGNFIKWKYTDDKEWTNLIDLTSLTGQNGKNGTSGKDGREIEVSTNDEYIVYRYKGETEWTKLIKLSSLKGKDGIDGTSGNDGTNGVNGTDGKEVEIAKDDNYIKWRYKGTDTWTNLIELSSLKGQDGTSGTDGSEVELINDGENIKWRYKGTNTWTNLTSLANLKGEKGESGQNGIDGSEIELVNDGTNIKWKYKDSSEDYVNLIDLETLKGQDANAWLNLGVVDTTTYCKIYNEGEENEYEDCGYFEYLKQQFPEAEEGNYIFTDNEDSFVWHVKVEKAEMQSSQYALIEYWSTEETMPYYIRAYKGNEETEWECYDLAYATRDDLNYYDKKINDLNNKYSDINTKYNDFTDKIDLDVIEYYTSTTNIEKIIELRYDDELYSKAKLSPSYLILNLQSPSTGQVIERYRVTSYKMAERYNGTYYYVEYCDIKNADVIRYNVLSVDYREKNKVWQGWKTRNDTTNLEQDIADLQAENATLKEKNEELQTKIAELEDEIGKITEVRYEKGVISIVLEEYFSNVSKMPVNRVKYYNFFDGNNGITYSVKVIGTDNLYIGTNYIEYYESTKPNAIYAGIGTMDNSTKDITWSWSKKSELN